MKGCPIVPALSVFDAQSLCQFTPAPQLPAVFLRAAHLADRHLAAECGAGVAGPRHYPFAGGGRRAGLLPLHALRALGLDRRRAGRPLGPPQSFGPHARRDGALRARAGAAPTCTSTGSRSSTRSRSCAGRSWRSTTPRAKRSWSQLVGRAELPNAIALNSSVNNATRIIGPAIAGVLIASVGVGSLLRTQRAQLHRR